MKAILNECKISVPLTSAPPENWRIDERIIEEVRRRDKMAMKSQAAMLTQEMLENECAVTDMIALVAMCELGWARGKKRFARYLLKQDETELKYIKKHGGTVVLGAKKGSDEYERAQDMREDLKRYLLSYGFDYDKFIEELKQNG